MKKRSRMLWLSAIAIVISLVISGMPATSSVEGPVSGALFTTDKDGLLVNGNIYSSKSDVYISGGPGPNAPPGAAGLPDGEYYFQVTDPSGKRLLSTDDISERHFRVHGGIIVEYLGSVLLKKNGDPAKNQRFEIVEEIENEYGENAIVIRLMPYKNTPNKGGVYKAWATPVNRYDPEDRHSFYGFIPQWSKTDNYKIKLKGGGKPEPPIQSFLELHKFYDTNYNGIIDPCEPELTGWMFAVTDPLGVTNFYYSPRVLDITANEGTYTITEIFPQGTWIQTAVVVNGVYQMPVTPTVTVTIHDNERHIVKYLNFALGWYGGGHTPGYWHNKNGQAEIGQDDLDYVEGLNPFAGPKPDFYPTGVDVPFQTKEDIALFLVGNIASEMANNMRYKLAKFFLAMELNVYNGYVDPESVIYLGPGDFQTVGDVLDYINAEYPWDGPGWNEAKQAYYKNALDAACNNENFLFLTPPPIVY